MGTKVECKNFLPGYYYMRDLNEDSNSSNWPLFYGDKTLPNGSYYNGFLPRTVSDAYPGYDKDALKQKMLQHEAIFKNQVYELHRLYRTQRDMMDEIKRKELYKHQIPIETSSSSTPLASQMPPEEARKWHTSTYPLANSMSARSSVSGAEFINSPLSCTKGNNTRAGPVPSQNGYSSKDCEVLESRPTKVRKLFDLQLPADEYLDAEEEEQPESVGKSFLGDRVRTDFSRDASCLRSSIGLADLNEPIQVEETNGPASVDFLGRACHGEIKGLDLSAKPKSQFLGISKEILPNSRYRSNNGNSNFVHLENKGKGNGNSNVVHLENKGNGREWLSYTYESDHSRSHLSSFPNGLQSDKLSLPSQPSHIMPNKFHQHPQILPIDPNRDRWRERTVHGIEISERSRDVSQFNQPEFASRVPSPYPFVNSSDLPNSWPHSVTSWGNPSSNLVQKLTSVQTHPYVNSSGTLSRNLMEPVHRNGFYHGSSSVSKELPTSFPSDGFDYLNCRKDSNFASGNSYNCGPGSYFKGSNDTDLKSSKDINLNSIFSKSSSKEAGPQRGVEIIDLEKKCEDRVAVLPWLKNEAHNARRDSNSGELSFLKAASNQFSNKSETAKESNQIFGQNITSSLCNFDVGAKKNEIGECRGSKKILGFPIFENLCNSKNESSSLVSTSASLWCPPQGSADNKSKARNGVIDINVACDPTVPELEVLVMDKEIEAKVANFRNDIDLNSCMSEEEIPFIPSIASTSAHMKIVLDIDLEAPPVPEIEEDFLPGEEQKPTECKDEHPHEEVIRIAAEAIVAISSSSHISCVEKTAFDESNTSFADTLHWFVEIVSNYGDDFELGTEASGRDGNNDEDALSDKIDDFEAMTLELREVKEEEYMPKPLVPDFKNAEEEIGANAVSSRTRRGPPRRGRQRRDFQRDILPGLSSLSRHEVTEDLQTFGGLMRAMGHPWHSGPNRRNGSRNGGARGRRKSMTDHEPAPVVAAAVSAICSPLMLQLNNIEVGAEDRSLTGWGKTTRRPRQKRCPAGNPPSVALT